MWDLTNRWLCRGCEMGLNGLMASALDVAHPGSKGTAYVIS